MTPDRDAAGSPAGAIPSLTGIRGVAALWVLLFHVQMFNNTYFHLPVLVRAPFDGGWSGVDLFFALSGFILMQAHGGDFARPTAAAVRRFAILRFFRVYPLNLAVLLLIAILVLADRGYAGWYERLAYHNLREGAFVRTAFLATRWFIPGDGDWNQPVWSLSAEVLGYACFPLIAWRLAAVKRAAFAAAIALASLGALAAVQHLRRTELVNDIGQVGSFTRMIFCFVAGAAASRCATLAGPGLRHAAILEVVAILAAVACGVAASGAPLRPLCFVVLIFALSFQRGPVDKLLSTGPALFLGRISFPLYLIHVTLLMVIACHFTASSPGAQAWALGLCVLGALGLASGLHYLLERPTHRMGRRIAGPAVPHA